MKSNDLPIKLFYEDLDLLDEWLEEHELESYFVIAVSTDKINYYGAGLIQDSSALQDALSKVKFQTDVDDVQSVQSVIPIDKKLH